MKEALKLALDALETLHDENMDYLVRNKLGGENNQCMVFARDVIKSIKRTLAQPADHSEQNLDMVKAQPEERNFCSRCGKRTADLTVIHTCTPPQENT